MIGIPAHVLKSVLGRWVEAFSENIASFILRRIVQIDAYNV